MATKASHAGAQGALRSGYHDNVGPIYRHVEELCFALCPQAPDARLLYKLAQQYDLPKPHVFKGCVRLEILHDALTALGLKGKGLTLRHQEGRYIAFYRTKDAGRAKGDLRELFAPLFSSPALNVVPELTGRRYQEFYVCIRDKTVRDQLVKSLPRQSIVPEAFERPKIRTFYGRTFKLSLPHMGTVPVGGVVYRPVKTKTPRRFKFATGPPRGAHRSAREPISTSYGSHDDTARRSTLAPKAVRPPETKSVPARPVLDVRCAARIQPHQVRERVGESLPGAPRVIGMEGGRFSAGPGVCAPVKVARRCHR